MSRVETGRAAIGRVDRILPAVHGHGRDGRAPVLTAGLGRIKRLGTGALVIDDFRSGHDSRPGALHKAAVPLADADGVAGAVADVGDADVAITVKDAVKGLPFIAAAERVGVRGAAAPKAAHVTADGPIRNDYRRSGCRRRIAAIVD